MIEGSFCRSEPAAELRGLAKTWLARLRLALVEREEGLFGHIDFAAHLADRWNVLALELLRHVVQRLDIGGDVLAFAAVAARRAGDELAVLVAQRHRQAVDLRLGGKHDLLIVGKPQEAADAADKIDHVGFGEGVVERQHRHRVPHLGEARRGRDADPLRQAFARAQLRKARLDRGVAPPQLVIFGVGDRRRVFLIIAPIVPGDFVRQPRVLGLRLFFGQSLDGGSVSVFSRRGHDATINPRRGSDARRRRGLRR